MSLPFDVYSALPWWLQNVACSAMGLKLRHERYGERFWRHLEQLRRNEKLARESLLGLQSERLERICTIANDTTEHYSEVFRRVGFNPRRFRLEDFLERVPVLSKDEVRRSPDRFRNRRIPGRELTKARTSGTTGKSMHLVQTREHVAAQWATWWRHRERFGLRVGDSYANFAGRDVVPTKDIGLPAWRVNLPMRQTYFSIFHLTDRNLPAVFGYLDARTYDYVSGYPSGLMVLAAFMNERGLRLSRPPRAVACGAETLLGFQRAAIEKAFGARVADQYGLSEGCANISECEKGRYHVDMDFAFTEVLPISEGEPRVGRVVGTTFFNEAMPLIRYDTGDVATLAEGTCACGRESTLVDHIDGRIESIVRTPDGRNVGRLDFLFKDAHRVVEAQILQPALERLVLRIVRDPRYGPADELALREVVEKYLGKEISVGFEYVDSIPREPNGKFRGIVSNLAPAHKTAASA